MNVFKIGLVVLLAGGISIGIAVLGQRWLDEPPTDARTSDRVAARLQTLPDFRLPDLDGQRGRQRCWAGKVVVINYWASWCPPCVREMPLFISIQETLGDAVQVVGIAVDRLADVEQFLADYPVNFPILMANPEAMAMSKRLGNRVEGLPFTVIFDRRGRRVFSHTGEVTAAELQSQLEALVNGRDLAVTTEDSS
jgi:thiol-disulfide isomerase/thioredoxin